MSQSRPWSDGHTIFPQALILCTNLYWRIFLFKYLTYYTILSFSLIYIRLTTFSSNIRFNHSTSYITKVIFFCIQFGSVKGVFVSSAPPHRLKMLNVLRFKPLKPLLKMLIQMGADLPWYPDITIYDNVASLKSNSPITCLWQEVINHMCTSKIN